MKKSGKPRWRIAALLVLGAAIATAVALQTRQYLDTPSGAGKQGDMRQLRIDATDPVSVAQGRKIYAQQCAACHGANLEGQANWRERLPNGRMPAPPHDASGHTWHHPDAVLFAITRNGLVAGVTAPEGYVSDMPAFGQSLSDQDIVAVLAYIKSTWPRKMAAAQREVTEAHAVRKQGAAQ
ncbi:c-type cytochrome [Cupriavidus taiwanensis]|uniref:c-type cytochrome n=1 Tax=Cupriavidus taiwanensis TaxID=164546 RepID=UPI000E10E82B|nr:c-type cytochrome [Cupriavidus taiwanensis]SOY70741.1 putative Cytochrome c, class I Gluconate 2-dehydrogenase cytochrome c subunit [Cupriavidus taiwanensis]SOY72264.1 putative Cytochrome c, class I Gluconate 2-dehydrogenase cytochrome c subunit [Cupriavidus taiwanensis]SOY95829.1 putative Cytochrome c, class I Gluconate 2-dehydrogenase cytochrome c subunit [Cupriavidus taiwanensis]SOZ30206.1 putative Cytochrome c, class I Gluconate 2-dehydrogenase cytochrome c subunit [Cupriavidus taiwanens